MAPKKTGPLSAESQKRVTDSCRNFDKWWWIFWIRSPYRKIQKAKGKVTYLCSAYYELLISRRSGMARVNEGSHSFTCHPYVYPQVEWTIPAFNPQPHSIAALWLVLIFRPAEGRKLSWPEWLGEILRWFARTKTVIRPSICRDGRKLHPRASSRESNALTEPPAVSVQ